MPIEPLSDPRREETGAGGRGARAASGVWVFPLAVLFLTWPLAVRGWQSPEGQSTPAAEEPAAPKGADSGRTEKQPIQVRVNVVNVPVTVLNKRGVPVIDLSQNDFEVFEDGKRQAIRYFYRGDRPPLRIGLLLDTSNSARPQLKFEQEAASEFVFNILQGRTNKNQILLQTFDTSSSVAEDFTSDPDALNEKIQKLKAGGGKALYDAIYFACKEKMLKLGPPNETRRVLVLVSDGNDVESQRSLDEAISMAHRAETVIYTIGNSAYGFHNPGDKILKQIAEGTGGAGFFPLQENYPGTDLETGYLSHGQIGDTSQNKGLGASTGIFSAEKLIHLADSLEAIGRELSDQYNIGYTPTNDKMDGTYRTIHVVALRKGVELRAKPGYFATPE